VLRGRRTRTSVCWLPLNSEAEPMSNTSTPGNKRTENKYADELPWVSVSSGSLAQFVRSTCYNRCSLEHNNRSLSTAGQLSRWGEALGRKHCKVGTAARILGEPLARTLARVANGELPIVVRDGHRLIPTTAVLELREQLLRENSLSPTPEANVEAPGAPQHQSPTSSWADDEPREFSARTVAEAIDVACAELGVSREDLVYEVRDSGLLHGCCTSPQVVTGGQRAWRSA
jgi:jag family protein